MRVMKGDLDDAMTSEALRGCEVGS
jgi:hypothetical protein